MTKPPNRTQKSVRQTMQQLMRAMDFASRHPALNQPGRKGKQMAEIYQLLGSAWEMLALQCPHRSGWTKLKDGTQTCKACGTHKGAREKWLLLPRTGIKSIGRMSRPTTAQTLPNRKAATVVKDEIRFHGARLRVDVLNPHQSSLLGWRDITIAADRLIDLREEDLRIGISEHLVRLSSAARRPIKGLPYSGFLSELPRRLLERFPVMVEYDRRGRFVGVVIFRERKAPRAQNNPKRRPAGKNPRGEA
jgi:hypothetical protein